MFKEDVISTLPLSYAQSVTDIAELHILGCAQNMPTLMNCCFISKDVVTVIQKASYTHYQVSRENFLTL